MSERFYGKYRGNVINNLDPMRIGRIMASVPDVGSGIPTTWAMPCMPISGRKSGTWMVPQIGAAVWIEFEQGDSDYPIWSGCFWGSSSEVPSAVQQGNPASPSIVLQTGLQNQIVLSDLPGPTGGISIKVASGASILINDLGITISNGKGASIELLGPNVNINKGALTVI
ncbi:MAG TPA: phage baseplate assembly protein V [Thermoanaerobaculia bacterium]|jgi:uncharacterized protein involved in type VI secretion and phage assembly|nr:phage baseplate assembly protein V [Thermoanaerobaculia bacterium]